MVAGADTSGLLLRLSMLLRLGSSRIQIWVCLNEKK